MSDAPTPRPLGSSAEVDQVLAAADQLAKWVAQIVDDRDFVYLEDLATVAHEYETLRYGTDGTVVPFTAIEERIHRASWVLRRLVSLHGFQAELRVWGGDYEERGNNVSRDVRINVRRASFDTEHIKTLTLFAESHGCTLEFSRDHGAVLRLRKGESFSNLGKGVAAP